MTTEFTVFAGTTKGVFILKSPDRSDWAFSGPHCKDWPINHVTSDGDDVWAVGGNDWWGAGVWHSGDGGTTWDLTRLSRGQLDNWLENEPEMAQMFGFGAATDAPFSGELDALWSIHMAGGRLFAGGKPGILIVSDDRGKTWTKVTGLTNHESRDTWNPGGAGMTLHTLISDPNKPNKLWAAISAAGVFASEDAGATWHRRNRISNADEAEIGHCVHNMVRAPGDDDLLYMQNHHGVYRSPDGGHTWQNITDGLPSDFGFPIMVSPLDPETVYTLPLLDPMNGRYPVGASAAVYRSRNGGLDWEKTQNGLPTENCYFTVLRQSMASDAADGLYFGTNSGSVFATYDRGDQWHEIASHLPTVLCVESRSR